jgi:hypothetical protein
MDPLSKKCCSCQIIKLLDFFYKEKKSKDGYYSICKQCKNEKIKIQREKTKVANQNIALEITQKECNICNEKLEIVNFTKDGTQKDGFSRYCKDCRRLKDKRLKQERATDQPSKLLTLKICLRCNETRDISNFFKSRKCNDGYLNICNYCRPQKTWTKEKQREAEKRYIEKNKEKIKEKWKRQGMNINRRIRNSLNHRISGAMFSNNLKKENRTYEIIGCNIEFLKKWMEYQFTNDMNWSNYGKWHIDHVKPCCSFDLKNEDEMKTCFNWKNLQPLWADDNLQKSGSINEELIKKHLVKALKYESIFSAQVKEGELLEPPIKIQNATTELVTTDVNA